MARFIQQEEPAVKPKRTILPAQRAAFELALEYAKATTPAKRAEIQRFFGLPENKKHAPMLVLAQKIPRGLSPQERENLLKQQLQH